MTAVFVPATTVSPCNHQMLPATARRLCKWALLHPHAGEARPRLTYTHGHLDLVNIFPDLLLAVEDKLVLGARVTLEGGAPPRRARALCGTPFSGTPFSTRFTRNHTPSRTPGALTNLVMSQHRRINFQGA